MSVIESAKRILVEWDKVRISFQVDQVEPESVKLARFVLSLSERLTPDVVEAAERQRKYREGAPFSDVYNDMRSNLVDLYVLFDAYDEIIAQLREGT